MKSKKALNIITAFGACVLLIASVFVFPFILAASPENRELETIEMDGAYPAEEMMQNGESELPVESGDPDGVDTEIDAEIDINAISKETAIEIVLDFMSTKNITEGIPSGDSRTTTLDTRGARYYASVDHIDAPIWRVLFYELTSVTTYEYFNDNQSLEEYIAEIADDINDCCYSYAIGTGNESHILAWEHRTESLFFIDVNAFTGTLIGQGMLYLCDHTPPFGTFSYDDDTDWELLKGDLTYWYFVDMGEPDPIPVQETETPSQNNNTGNGIIRIPDLVGSTQEEALAILSEADLDLNITQVESNSPKGIVVYILNVGETVPAGTLINIHVSNGIKPAIPTPEPSPALP